MSDDINRCQYWNSSEQPRCKFWNNDQGYCTYYSEVNGSVFYASHYPYCNNIGTEFKCNAYLPLVNEAFATCILPNTLNQAEQAQKCCYVTTSTVISGTNIEALDYSNISEYNKGTCNFVEGSEDTGGTAIKCSCFSPFHLGFGKSKSLCTLSGVSYELPLDFKVRNIRSKIGRCYWWDSGDVEYTVDTLGKIEPPIFSCNHSDTTYTFNFLTYNYEDEMWLVPPCNGSKPECKYYTGSIIPPNHGLTFLEDKKISTGSKVLAEQLFELRYNIKKETWVKDVFYESFQKPEIYAYEGTSPSVIYGPDNVILDYSIDVTRVYISDFKCFLIDTIPETITKGNLADDDKPDYPTLIEDLGCVELVPIIRSNFIKNDINTNTEFIFEVPTKEDKYIKLVGDNPIYEAEVIAFNLSEFDDFPINEVLKYKSMYDIKKSYSNTSEGEKAFEARLNLFRRFIYTAKRLLPDKVYNNKLTQGSAFDIDVGTLFSDNNIIVVSYNDNYLEYTKILIEKVYCGGILIQNSFVCAPGNKKWEYLYDFTSVFHLEEFGAYLSYKFVPFNSKRGIPTSNSYMTYCDTAQKALPPIGGASNSQYDVGYKLYKIKVYEDVILNNCSTSFFGNAGHVLLDFPDEFKLLHSVVRPFEVGDVYINGTDVKGENKTIEMVVLYAGLSSMENNQIIIKPKDLNTYNFLYNMQVVIGNVFIYEKYSFGEEPNHSGYLSFEELYDSYYAGGTNSDAIKVFEPSITSNNNDYTLTDLPKATIVMSVMFEGTTSGYVKGQIKSEMVTWVRQPYCSSVEISYAWSAWYNWYVLRPIGICSVDTVGKTYWKSGVDGYAPVCGDHGYTPPPQCGMGGRMWYPYNRCASYANYEEFAASGENDRHPMEFWQCAYENYKAAATIVGTPPEGAALCGSTEFEHGSWDMRMLGPRDNYGRTIDTHISLFACLCDYTHANGHRASDSWFSGSARIVTALEGEPSYNCVMCGGARPPFGNKYRDQLVTYRSEACLYYYHVPAYANQATRDIKWMQIPESFYYKGITSEYKYHPFIKYFNNDNIDSYVNQMGITTVCDVETVSISETLLQDRYRFDEVFKTHSCLNCIVYPEPLKQYYKGSDPPIAVKSWYTYRQTPISNKAIQFAWREEWKLPNIISFFPEDLTRELNIDNDKEIYSLRSIDNLPIPVFIDVFYLNYTYNYETREIRRVCTEGVHNVTWKVGYYKDEKIEHVYFLCKLDNGPTILFDGLLNRITDENEIPSNLDFSSINDSGEGINDIIAATKYYRLCSTSEWLNDSVAATDLEPAPKKIVDTGFLYPECVPVTSYFTLYDEDVDLEAEDESDAIDLARASQRYVAYYDNNGTEQEFYFNRGLMIRLNGNACEGVPKNIVKLGLEGYEYKISKQTDDTSEFSNLDVTEFYPADIPIVLYYKTESLYGNVVIDINFIESYNIAAINLSFNFGTSTTIMWYNIPSLLVQIKTNGVYKEVSTSIEIFSDEEKFTIENSVVNLKLDLEHMARSTEAIKIIMSINNQNFIRADKSNFYVGEVVELVGMHFDIANYVNSELQVETFERKFNISIGGYGDIPVHGADENRSLMYSVHDDNSTPQQSDNRDGIFGEAGTTSAMKTISKTRGRLLGQVNEMFENIYDDYLRLESKQKELYDTVSNSGSTNINYTVIVNELMRDFLDSVGVGVAPVGNLVMLVDMLGELKSVETQEKFYPSGHVWLWWPEDPEMLIKCGPGTLGYVWGRTAEGNRDFVAAVPFLGRWQQLGKYIAQQTGFSEFGSDFGGLIQL